MNTKKKVAIASTIGAFAVMALVVAYPAMASSTGDFQTFTPRQLLQRSAYLGSQQIQLTSGQTVTLASVAGGYWTVGERDVNGTASGAITLQVSGDLKGGYILTVTGGSFTVNGTTYTISSGSAELGPRGLSMVGSGQAGTAQFLFLGRDLGSFGSTNYGVLWVDLKNGNSEFATRLLVTITV